MQTKMQSLIESATNIGSGFIVSVLVWQLLAKWYGYDMPLSRNLEITTIFTVVSLARSYVCRRGFNWWQYRGAKRETSDGSRPACRADGTGTRRAD